MRKSNLEIRKNTHTLESSLERKAIESLERKSIRADASSRNEVLRTKKLSKQVARHINSNKGENNSNHHNHHK